jgi:hypothetical protein
VTGAISFGGMQEGEYRLCIFLSFPRKTVRAVFFDVKGITNVEILRKKANLNSESFKENIVKEVDLIVYPIGQKPQTTSIYAYFDHAPVQTM